VRSKEGGEEEKKGEIVTGKGKKGEGGKGVEEIWMEKREKRVEWRERVGKVGIGRVLRERERETERDEEREGGRERERVRVSERKEKERERGRERVRVSERKERDGSVKGSG
jgi:hypothetical protein